MIDLIVCESAGHLIYKVQDSGLYQIRFVSFNSLTQFTIYYLFFPGETSVVDGIGRML